MLAIQRRTGSMNEVIVKHFAVEILISTLIQQDCNFPPILTSIFLTESKNQLGGEPGTHLS